MMKIFAASVVLILGLAVLAQTGESVAPPEKVSPSEALTDRKPASKTLSKNSAKAKLAEKLSSRSSADEAKPAEKASSKPADEAKPAEKASSKPADEAKPAEKTDSRASSQEKQPAESREKKTKAELESEAFALEILSKLPPGGTVIGPIDSSGRTWAMSGVYAKPIEQLKKELSDVMRAEQYELLHEIPLTDDQSKLLIAWKKKEIKLIFMLWKMSDGETGFSWGRSQ
ncbi:MAG: hypothetical protein J5944_11435 [Lentisphaeria bacterium]|nr:hypothetical protein [Lentisphaeria bacterium]